MPRSLESVARLPLAIHLRPLRELRRIDAARVVLEQVVRVGTEFFRLAAQFPDASVRLVSRLPRLVGRVLHHRLEMNEAGAEVDIDSIVLTHLGSEACDTLE